MSIALIDQDCLGRQKRNFFYDLDIMKLASYYKSTKEITKLLLEPKEYTQYTKTFFIKNRFNYRVDKNVFVDPRITYRGYAFSANCYEPLEPNVEKAPADLSVYSTYLKYNTTIAKRRLSKILSKDTIEGCHTRVSTNGVSCNVEDKYVIYKKLNNSLFLYDYNLFDLEDWMERMKDFKDYSIRFKFMPKTSELSHIKHIFDNYTIFSENHFILQNLKEGETDKLDEIIALGKNNKDRIRIQLLEDLNPYDDDIFMNQIIHAINTILAFKQSKARIHAYINPRDVDERTVFLNNLSVWSNNNHGDISFYSFLHTIRGSFIKVDALAERNERFAYLYTLIPSKWEKGL